MVLLTYTYFGIGGEIVARNALSNKQLKKLVVSTVVVTSSLGLGQINNGQIVYASGSIISTQVLTLNNGFNGEATQLRLKSDIDYPFREGDQFHLTLPSGVSWNDSFSLDGTVTNATYHRVDDRSIQVTVTGNPNEIVIPLQVRINDANLGALDVIIDASPNSSIPVGRTTFAVVREQPSSSGDGTPPVLESIEVSPTTVGVGDTVTVKARITDDISGVDKVSLNYYNLSKNRTLGLEMHYDSETDFWVENILFRLLTKQELGHFTDSIHMIK